MGTETNKDERNTPEYLAQLLKDKKQIQAFPNVFIHLEKLLDEEINRARLSLFHCKNGGREPLSLPEPYGPVVTLSEKLFVPVKEHPEFNFVGRILGPRGMTAKELEQFTGCKIMVRGKGSMRDKQKEEQNRGKPNWEHLNEELHVLITVEDTGNRGEIKLSKAVEEVKKLLVPAPDGEDDLKKRQLMELAIINGTYRDTSKPSTSTPQQQQTTSMSPTCLLRPQFLRPYFTYTPENCNMDASKGRCGEAFMFHEHQNYQPLRFDQAQRFITSPLALQQTLRSPTPTGAPIILAPRMPTMQTALHSSSGNTAGLMNGAPPPLVSPTEAPSGLIYNPYEYPYSFSPATAIFEYPGMIEQSAAGAVPKVRRTLTSVRDHPYAPVRVSLP